MRACPRTDVELTPVYRELQIWPGSPAGSSRPERHRWRQSIVEGPVSRSERHPAIRRVFPVIAVALVCVVAAAVALVAQGRRDFDVVARKYSFRVSGSDRAEMRVAQGDLVHVNFSTEDIPHSFTIEDQNDSHY